MFEELLNASDAENNGCAVNHTVALFSVCEPPSKKIYLIAEHFDKLGSVKCFGFFAYLIMYFQGLQELNRYSKRNESWYCIFHWLLVSFASLLFFLPTPYSILSYLVSNEDKYGWPKHCFRYLLTLYAYVLVSMALFSYNAVFKTLFKTPLSRLQWCMFFAVLYIMSSFSTLYCAYVYGWIESYDCDMVCYVLTWMFSRYPDQRDIMILLLWNHIIPASFNFYLISKVRKELLRRNELDLFVPAKTYSLCLGDRKLIALSKFLCIYYAIASTPLIMRETVKWITESKAIDAYMPNYFEALPFYFILLESFFFFKLELNEFETVWDEFKIDTRQRLKAIKQS
ncbi:uncharacterized protein TNIN_405941 [Trichonephila inaurata madagascariensis]|uniref:Uncharacterized protein n=1 Tax=Trichonephila inaurata madagascariensis TaxID=2747483 RepID=A0A8X7CMK9_9ARAC|nr:uncharacterized protein TNIN_405941 [Trichonephila inaurata madagascariensis]